MNTSELQTLIDAGGRVVVPRGVHVVGTLWLRDNVELHLEAGAVLKGSDNIEDYCANDSYPQNHGNSTVEGWRGAHLIVAHEVHDVSITGCGIIDGNAAAFMKPDPNYSDAGWGAIWQRGMRVTDKSKAEFRPGQVVVFCECDRVRLEGVTLRNCPCWSCFVHGCEDVIIRGVRIDNDVDLVNSDGIDIDSSSRVLVSGCNIRTGDDALTLRASNRRLTRRPGHSCEDVLISDCIVDTSACAVRIGVGAGVIRNALLTNLVITHAGVALCISPLWDRAKKGCEISDITISNLRGRKVFVAAQISAGPGALELTELEDTYIRNITLSDWEMECASGVEVCELAGLVPEVAIRDCNFRLVDAADVR